MAITDSKLFEALGANSQMATFEALSIAAGTDLDDEEKLQKAVDNICDAKNCTAEIDWLNGMVRFDIATEV